MTLTQQRVMEETGLRPDECRALVRRGIINYEDDIRLTIRRVIRFAMSTKLKTLGGSDGELDPHQERARKDKELADKTALQNALTRGEMIERGFFHRFMTEAFGRVRSKMLAIPSKVAPVVIHLDNIPDAQAKLTEAVHDALNELSETTVEAATVESAGETRRDRGGESDLDDLESAPEPERKRVGRPRKTAEPGGQRRTGTMGYEPR